MGAGAYGVDADAASLVAELDAAATWPSVRAMLCVAPIFTTRISTLHYGREKN